MTTATIDRTKNYLIIKIPLRGLKRREVVTFDPKDEELVNEGLKAIAEGRVSKSFRNVREAILHLKKL
ncbi:MAG TPA: hypothetical protein DEP08_00800 [Candidatus Jacksonbacteria bacterium]|nr:MAG: hypothetical protein UX07_C0024G0003 [Parcubacteria group bacterium GW2011_GWA2_45_30]HCE86328.1 hypothetical protein [Candidatus Jacksonbacteria bacterium]